MGTTNANNITVPLAAVCNAIHRAASKFLAHPWQQSDNRGEQSARGQQYWIFYSIDRVGQHFQPKRLTSQTAGSKQDGIFCNRWVAEHCHSFAIGSNVQFVTFACYALPLAVAPTSDARHAHNDIVTHATPISSEFNAN